MKLNLRAKTDAKVSVGCQLYASDKAELEHIAESEGVPLSIFLRSMINDVLDSYTKLAQSKKPL